jgi:16S rRNA (adenine1518-N6/adenine1519-N6)-dimethyltransferase
MMQVIQSAEPRRVKLVANLPYNIASPLIVEMLIAGVEMLVFTVQKEVADRLRAGAGEEAYGPLSVMAQMLASVEVLRVISPQVFWPAPKIESALVRMIRADRLGERAAAFSKFVHQVFSYRRKTLRKALSEAGYAPGVLEQLSIDPQARPETLSPQQFLSLFAAAAGGG